MADNAERRNAVKNTSIFSVLTMLSRLLGLARDMLKAYAFGTGIASVAFDIAFRLPNMLRNLVAEGALSQSFIPVYEKYRNKDAADGRKAIAAVLGFFLLIMGVISILVIFALPHVIPALIGDLQQSNETTRLTINLSQILFPYILFMSLASIYMAAQYSHGIFWSASLGPALLNLIILLGFGVYFFIIHVYFQSIPEKDIYAFAIVTLLAGFAQLVFQRHISRKNKISAGISFQFRHPVIRDLFLMMLPGVFSAAVQEIGQLIDIYLATRIESQLPGSVSALTYSHRLIQLPIGVFGVAVATASLPQLSRLFVEEKFTEYKSALLVSVRLNLYLLIPPILGLMLFSENIVSLLFERGEFNANSTVITAKALTFYAPGILAYALQKLFLSAMYARRKSGLPAVITVIVLILNVIISILLIPYLMHAGLALGSALAAYIGVLIYVVIMGKKKLLPGTKETFAGLPALLFVQLLTAGSLLLVKSLPISSGLQLGTAIFLAGVVYIGFSKLLHIPEFTTFVEIFQKLLARVRR